MIRFGGRAKLRGVLVALCLCALGASAQTPPELPALSFESFEPEIAAQLRKAYAEARARPQDAELQGRLGMALHAYEQFEFAARCYERAGALAPNEFRWAYFLGIAQAELGRQAEAVRAFQMAQGMRPEYGPLRLRLAEALLADGKQDDSRRLFEEIAGKDGDLAQAWYGLGRIAAAAGDAATAVADYRKAIALFAEYGAASYALGMALRDQGKAAEAREHLARSQQWKTSRPFLQDAVFAGIVELNVGAGLHLKSGAALERAGQLKESIAEYERALEINPRMIQAHINLISLCARAGQPEKAEKYYRAALALQTELPDLHYNYGVLLVGQGRFEEAARAFERTLQLNPYYAEAHHNLAVMREREGRLDEAAAHYRQAIANKPAYRSAHFFLGRILVSQNSLAEAVEEFRQTLTPEDDETPRNAYALGATLIRMGERQKGLAFLRDALKRATALNQTQLAASIERDLKTLEQDR